MSEPNSVTGFLAIVLDLVFQTLDCAKHMLSTFLRAQFLKFVMHP